MNKHIRYILTFSLMLFAKWSSAQVSVEQSVDSVAILIGEQAHLKLSVSFPEGSTVQWPKLKERQYIAPGVEVVEASPSDTIDKTNALLKVEKTYTITSFDEKLYAIPALEVKVNGKSYKGNTSALKVITMDVDTLHPNQFYGPKDVQSNPFLWSEWSPLFWLSLLVVILGASVFYLYLRLKENKPIITKVRIIKHIPPHQRAMKAIEKIKADRMAASEDQKAYYTQLTDTLRQYIQERFGFNAKEMTSDEIIDHLRSNGDKKMIDELRELFQTADLVKFAKYSTLMNENDLNLVNAVNFIDETKLEGQAVEEKIVPKLSENEKKTRSNRITIKSLISAACIIILALLSYILYNIYLLTI